MAKVTKPRIAIELEPGEYIVSVAPGHRLAWRHQGSGLFIGHGGKIRRPTIADGINELLIAAERGVEERWGPCPKCGSPKFKTDREARLVRPQDATCNMVELISHCFSCGHEVSRITEQEPVIDAEA